MDATQVLIEHWNGELPVDPEKIAKSLGMNVKHIDPLGDDFNLSGKFQMEGDSPVAYYNLSEPNTRQRFTLAHEIGHYILGHGDALRDPASHFRTTSHDYKEIEANNFAAQLLMPKNILKKLARSMEGADLDSLAKIFGVSQVAMKFRLKNLGIIH